MSVLLNRLFLARACPSTQCFGFGSITRELYEGCTLATQHSGWGLFPSLAFRKSYLLCDFSSCEDLFSRATASPETQRIILEQKGVLALARQKKVPLPEDGLVLLESMAITLKAYAPDPQRSSVLRNAAFRKKGLISLSETRKNRIMACIDRSALCAYWLSRLGEPAMVVSGLHIADNNEPRGHALVAIPRPSGQTILFDPSFECYINQKTWVPFLSAVDSKRFSDFCRVGAREECWLAFKNIWSGQDCYLGFAPFMAAREPSGERRYPASGVRL